MYQYIGLHNKDWIYNANIMNIERFKYQYCKNSQSIKKKQKNFKY